MKWLSVLLCLAGCASSPKPPAEVYCDHVPEAGALSSHATVIAGDSVQMRDVAHIWIMGGSTTEIQFKTGEIVYLVNTPCLITGLE